MYERRRHVHKRVKSVYIYTLNHMTTASEPRDVSRRYVTSEQATSCERVMSLDFENGHVTYKNNAVTCTNKPCLCTCAH